MSQSETTIYHTLHSRHRTEGAVSPSLGGDATRISDRASAPLQAVAAQPSGATGLGAQLVLSGRLDVLVHAKEVVRVVCALHLGEAIVVRTVGGAHAIAFV